MDVTSFEHPAVPGPRGRRLVARAYRGLPRPVRLVAWAVAVIVAGAVIGMSFPAAMRSVGTAVALAPDRLAWYTARVTGFVAYGAIAGSVVYGLLLSTRLLDAIAHRPVTFHLHRDLALVGLGLSALHGVVLLADRTFAFTFAAIAVPFASPYAAVAVGIGQVAFYLVAVVTVSFYVRGRIGQRAWRAVHYATFLAFVGVTAHGIAAGSDSGQAWAAWIYLAPIAAVVFLVTYRIAVAVAERRTSGQGGTILVEEPTARGAAR